MKLNKLALIAAIACGTYASNVSADQTNDISLVSHCAAAACDCGQPVCGCDPAGCDTTCNSGCETGCDTGCAATCDSACGCDSGCDSGCGLGSCTDCDLGDPFALFGEHCGYSMGGWIQLGYHSKGNTLFNSRPDELQLHQAWLYAEKAIDTSCGFDIGGRIDYIYGTDSQDTQAFGTDPSGWDNDWDNGPDYGHALPQVYVEAGYGDMSVKIGHFYTIIGWEVVTAPDNFFYSHAYTMYNSEPFTHTGVLATYNVSDDVTAYGGYTFGWDSGFDDNGDSFLGGLSLSLTDDLTLTYATVGGRFGEARFNGVEKGYMHSIVADMALSDNLQYIFQSDYLTTDDNTGATVRDTIGINQYMIYTLNDCWAAGARFEWYENEGVYTDPGATAHIYQWTLGLNYRPHANLIVRPEIRWDWVSQNDAVLAAGNTVLENGDDDQTTFGIDTIFTF